MIFPRFVVLACMAGLLGLMPHAHGAEPPGGAWVIDSKGGVVLLESGKERPLASLTRLGSGVRLRVDSGAQVRFVFPRNARLETWRGKAIIQIGDSEGMALAYQVLPVSKVLPDYLVQGLSAFPAFSGSNQAKFPRTRGISKTDKSRLDQSQARYIQLRGESADQDILPELYLLGELTRFGAYGAMAQPMDEMLARQGQDAAVQAWVRRYRGWADAGVKAGN